MQIAMIGIKAIPARFGGFETAVDELSRGLVKRGHCVRVYNRSGMSTCQEKTYQGVELVTLPTFKSKNLSTIGHAFLCTLHVLLHPVDVVHYFTTGTTIFAILPRIFGMKVVCSVDGTDWQRGKWGRFARAYLRYSERLAVRLCNGLISDSKDVQRYYEEQYSAESKCIVYGMREYESNGVEWLDKFGLKPRDYVLFVGRLVPENNIHVLIESFASIQTNLKLVIVGDDPWEKDYVRNLKSTNDPRVVFTGGVYGEGYVQFQKNAYLFVLPDEVGGTHPALVEAMGYGNCVLVNDTPSNLEVIGDAGRSYQGAGGSKALTYQMQELLDNSPMVEQLRAKAYARALECYRWEQVVKAHEEFYAEHLGAMPAPENSLGFDRPRSERRGPLVLKRVLDVFCSGMLLILLLPFLLAISLAVKFSSPGPIFYRWRVVGKRGRAFTSYKFRSMYVDADERKAALLAQNEMSGPVFKMTQDPRITRFGRWLRRYSLDELPQLFSVFKGDMSLVGPRPPLQTEYEQFTDFQKKKLAVKPGMTCLWQVSGRNQVSDFNEWVKLDLKYINEWSLWLDCKILLQTAVTVFAGSGK